MNKIYEYRKATNLTQGEFAQQINLTQGALGHYESGRRTRFKNCEKNCYGIE